MTPAQMLRQRLPKVECEPTPFKGVSLESTTYDFAKASGLTAYDCLKAKKCPICGRPGTLSTIFGMQTSFFYCPDRAHIFEMDDTTGDVDRIGR